MAIAEETIQQLNVRIPKTLVEKVKHLAGERGESLNTFLARELDELFSGRKLTETVATEAELERVFCLWYARKYDVTEIEALKELAIFRGCSILEAVARHIHGGVQEAYFLE